jgi:hypothetical protein
MDGYTNRSMNGYTNGSMNAPCRSMSTVLGIAWGCFSAYIFKNCQLGHHLMTEMTLFVLISYIPYLCAQVTAFTLHLNGSLYTSARR